MENAFLSKNESKNIRRIVASPSFYCESNSRFVVILVKNDEELQLNSVDFSQHVHFWFAKAFCFVRNRNKNEATFGNEVLLSTIMSQNDKKNNSRNDFEEYCFLQFF